MRIENNTGQVPGLPPNPRITNPAKLDKLVESIKQDPEMLQLRGLLVYPIEDGKYITIGGNMRLQALKRLGFDVSHVSLSPRKRPLKNSATTSSRTMGISGIGITKHCLTDGMPWNSKNGQLTFRNLRNNRKKRNVPGGTLPPTHKKACVI